MSALIDKIATRFRKEAPSALRVELPPHLRLPAGLVEVHVRLSKADWRLAQKLDWDDVYEAMGVVPRALTFIPRDEKHPWKVVVRCVRADVEKLCHG